MTKHNLPLVIVRRLRWHHHQGAIKLPVTYLTDWNQGRRTDRAGDNVHLIPVKYER